VAADTTTRCHEVVTEYDHLDVSRWLACGGRLSRDEMSVDGGNRHVDECEESTKDGVVSKDDVKR
jgi:hypothetical protein